MKIKSNFAILDVTTGRQKLFEHFKERPLIGECPKKLRVPVVIHGYIDGAWGGDDGTSREFTVVVNQVSILDDK